MHRSSHTGVNTGVNNSHSGLQSTVSIISLSLFLPLNLPSLSTIKCTVPVSLYVTIITI